VKDGTVSVCLIDDCQDADVPLAELVFADIYILHKFYPQNQGCSYFRLIGDYYNRALSGWEPTIEKWGLVFLSFRLLIVELLLLCSCVLLTVMMSSFLCSITVSVTMFLFVDF